MPKITGPEAEKHHRIFEWLYEHEGEWERTDKGIISTNGKPLPDDVIEWGRKNPLR